MKKKILLFALLFNFISHAQDAVFLSHLDVDNSGLFYFKNKLYSGNVVELFSNGQKKNEFNVLSGLKTGTYRTFHLDNSFKKSIYKDTSLINSTLAEITQIDKLIRDSRLDTTQRSMKLNGYITNIIGGSKKLEKLKVKKEEGKLNSKKTEDLDKYEDLKKSFLSSVLLLNDNLEKLKEQNNIYTTEDNKPEHEPILNESYDIVDGLKEGKYSRYNTKGILIQNGVYSKNKQNGEWKYYYDSGKIHGTGKYNMGDGGNKSESSGFPKNGRFGIWKFYFEDGTLSEQSEYKNGVMHGASLNYHQNASLKSKSTYVDGNREGTSTEFYDDGQIHKTFEYKKGVQDGMTLIYHSNGELDKKYNYVSGSLNGVYERYNDNGVQILKATTSNGKFNGYKKEFYDDGTLKMEGNYKDDLAEGIQKSYYPSGKIETISNCSKGKFNGGLKKYFENGNLMLDGTYVNDKSHGPTKIYYENGQLQISTFVDTNSIHEGNISGETLSYDENGVLTQHLILNNDGTSVDKLAGKIFENNKAQINRPYACRCCKRQINGLRNGVDNKGQDFDEFTYKSLMGGSVQALMPLYGYKEPHSYLRNEWWKFCSMKCSRTCYE